MTPSSIVIPASTNCDDRAIGDPVLVDAGPYAESIEQRLLTVEPRSDDYKNLKKALRDFRWMRYVYKVIAIGHDLATIEAINADIKKRVPLNCLQPIDPEQVSSLLDIADRVKQPPIPEKPSAPSVNPSDIHPGSVVGKRGKAGWKGKVVAIKGRSAEVLWVLDEALSFVPIDELEAVAPPEGWYRQSRWRDRLDALKAASQEKGVEVSDRDVQEAWA